MMVIILASNNMIYSSMRKDNFGSMTTFLKWEDGNRNLTGSQEYISRLCSIIRKVPIKV